MATYAEQMQSTDYSDALKQSLKYFGFSDDDIAQLQRRGVSLGDLQGLGLVGDPGPNTARESYQNANLLRTQLKGGAQQQAPGTAPTAWQPTGSSPGVSYLGGTAAGSGYTRPLGTMNFAGAPTQMATAGGGSSNMTWDQVARQIGLSARDVTQFTQMGYSPDEIAQSGGHPTAPPASKTQGTQAGPAAPLSPTSNTQPETQALAQMAQIDPRSEALRSQVGQTYLTQMQQAGRAPAQADVQSYLDLYKGLDPQGYAMRSGMTQQISDYVTRVTGNAPSSPQDALAKYSQLDPQGYAQMQQLSGSMGGQLSSAEAERALGTQLSPSEIREVEQQTRAGQAARGNIYGTPQLVAEAMARGQQGEARQQQRIQNLAAANQAMGSYLQGGPTAQNIGQGAYGQGLAQTQGALGLQQGWLGSGQTIGDVANTLYGQGYARQQQALGGALSYLGSGQTPYQAGSSYYQQALGSAAGAAQGGPQYNPQQLGPSYAGAQFPQYGLDTSQLANQWYNSIGAYGGQNQPSQPNRMGSALGGAGAGALSGAAAGSALGPYGTVIGGLVGGIAGGVGGYSR